MVSSSKKKRGKQRKAAKTAAAAASSNPTYGTLDPNDLNVFDTLKGATFFHPTHHELAALYVQKGNSKATESMTT